LQTLLAIESIAEARHSCSRNHPIVPGGMKNLGERGELLGAIREPVKQHKSLLGFLPVVQKPTRALRREEQLGFPCAKVLKKNQSLLERSRRLRARLERGNFPNDPK
jgi:hypothetical protein